MGPMGRPLWEISEGGGMVTLKGDPVLPKGAFILPSWHPAGLCERTASGPLPNPTALLGLHESPERPQEIPTLGASDPQADCID